MSGDLASSIVLLGLLACASALYGVRVLRLGAARHARVESAGASPLLGRTSMEAAYWAFGPLASGCVALGLSANAITWASLAVGLGAGVLLATGHFGLAAAATALASLCDALDGLVARKSGTAGDAGEVFDAAVDRYVELFFLGGLAVFLRESPAALLLVLAAILGSFMVSYSTAKAEALGVSAPRGAMRRAERAVVLFAGALLTPFAAAYAAGRGLAPSVAIAPILAALGLVAAIANVSAVRRLRAIAASVRIAAKQAAKPKAAPAPEELDLASVDDGRAAGRIGHVVH